MTITWDKLCFANLWIVLIDTHNDIQRLMPTLASGRKQQHNKLKIRRVRKWNTTSTNTQQYVTATDSYMAAIIAVASPFSTMLFSVPCCPLALNKASLFRVLLCAATSNYENHHAERQRYDEKLKQNKEDKGRQIKTTALLVDPALLHCRLSKW